MADPAKEGPPDRWGDFTEDAATVTADAVRIGELTDQVADRLP